MRYHFVLFEVSCDVPSVDVLQLISLSSSSISFDDSDIRGELGLGFFDGGRKNPRISGLFILFIHSSEEHPQPSPHDRLSF